MTSKSAGVGVQNGELLGGASGRVDVFITMDRKLERQQDLAALPFGVVLRESVGGHSQ